MATQFFIVFVINIVAPNVTFKTYLSDDNGWLQVNCITGNGAMYFNSKNVISRHYDNSRRVINNGSIRKERQKQQHQQNEKKNKLSKMLKKKIKLIVNIKYFSTAKGFSAIIYKVDMNNDWI